MSGSSSVGGKGPAGDVSFNYVPFIDVTFNMIIFFVLTSEVANATLSRVLVSSPEESQAVKRDKVASNNVVINVVSRALDNRQADPQFAAQALQYEVDGTVVAIGETDKLIEAIKDRRGRYQKLMAGAMGVKGEFFVEIRADYRIDYNEVKPVLVAISKAGVPRMAITAKAK